MRKSCLKFSILAIVGVLSFLLISETPARLEITELPEFSL